METGPKRRNTMATVKSISIVRDKKIWNEMREKNTNLGGNPNDQSNLGIALDRSVEILVARQIDHSTRGFIFVLNDDPLTDLQSIHEFFLELLQVDVTGDTDGNQIILERHLDLHGATAGRGDLSDRAGLSVHRWSGPVLGDRRLVPLVGGTFGGLSIEMHL